MPRENIAYYLVWNAFKSLLVLNNGLQSFLSGVYPRLARATLGFGKVKLYEHLLGGILGMDLEQAADFIVRRQRSGMTSPPCRPATAACNGRSSSSCATVRSSGRQPITTELRVSCVPT